ncbi:superoxide dismutase [Candidatus Uhrbacteria bacterium]|nr:superoxide dismutase [Candidatus Uhrbacteria bacterium]
MPYSEQQFNLPELKGLSAKQVDVHLRLYAGYVKNVNAVMAKIEELKAASEKNALALSELKRRFPFEFNGMRLHELYFEALGGDGGMVDGGLQSALAAQWGSVDAWLTEFKAVGMMRGIGWTLLTYDAKAGVFHNIWVNDHELGHLGDLRIILAMDVWEHAFLIDYLPAERPDYINAFFMNLKWDVCEARFTAAK